MKRKYITLIGVFLWLLTTAVQCQKEFPCSSQNESSLDFKVKVNPEKTEFHIGDTVWFTIQIIEKDMLKSANIEEYLDTNTSSDQFHFSFYYVELIKGREYLLTDPNSYELIDYKARLIAHLPSDYRPYSANLKKVNLTYFNGIYELKFGVVLKKQGAFGFCVYDVGLNKRGMKCSYQISLPQIQLDVLNHNESVFKDKGFTTRMKIGDERFYQTFNLDNIGVIYGFHVVK